MPSLQIRVAPSVRVEADRLNGVLRTAQNLRKGAKNANGTEIYFSCKPSESVQDALKGAGFRWHGIKNAGIPAE